MTTLRCSEHAFATRSSQYALPPPPAARSPAHRTTRHPILAQHLRHGGYFERMPHRSSVTPRLSIQHRCRQEPPGKRSSNACRFPRPSKWIIWRLASIANAAEPRFLRARLSMKNSGSGVCGFSPRSAKPTVSYPPRTFSGGSLYVWKRSVTTVDSQS